MARPPKDQAAPAPTTVPTKAFVVQNVYGPMVHLLLDKRIDGPTEFAEIDPWLQAQIDAGKVVLCS